MYLTLKMLSCSFWSLKSISGGGHSCLHVGERVMEGKWGGGGLGGVASLATKALLLNFFILQRRLLLLGLGPKPGQSPLEGKSAWLLRRGPLNLPLRHVRRRWKR